MSAALGAAVSAAVSAALQSYQPSRIMCETHEFSSLLKPRFTDVMPRFAQFLRINFHFLCILKNLRPKLLHLMTKLIASHALA